MKTSELIRDALDLTVAKCRGEALLHPLNNEWEPCWMLLGDNSGDYYNPSIDWLLGGPIIESEGIALSPPGGTRWWMAQKNGYLLSGPTPLIAAMRCYVMAEMGKEIDIPDELMEDHKNVRSLTDSDSPW